jgi:heptosyltransferase-2
LPSKGLRYFPFFWKLRRQYPDVHFLFTNSLRGDLEACLCGAPLRLGGSTGRKRKLLSHQAIVSKEFDKKHQTALWGEYLKFFGLKGAIDFTPFFLSETKKENENQIICLAPGSSNTPEKRWPITNWIKLLKLLIENFPSNEFILVGTTSDSQICKEIKLKVPFRNVRDLCGKTNLVELCSLFSNAKALICNDSGAMHLANAMSTPTVAIFGVTESLITGPAFTSPVMVVNSIDSDNVAAEVINYLEG